MTSRKDYQDIQVLFRIRVERIKYKRLKASGAFMKKIIKDQSSQLSSPTSYFCIDQHFYSTTISYH